MTDTPHMMGDEVIVTIRGQLAAHWLPGDNVWLAAAARSIPASIVESVRSARQPEPTTTADVDGTRKAIEEMGAQAAGYMASLMAVAKPVVANVYNGLRHIHDADPEAFHDGTGWAKCPLCDQIRGDDRIAFTDAAGDGKTSLGHATDRVVLILDGPRNRATATYEPAEAIALGHALIRQGGYAQRPNPEGPTP